MRIKKFAVAAAALLAIPAAWFLLIRPALYRPDPGLAARLKGIVEDYRKIIVLMDVAEAPAPEARTPSKGVA